jgi:tetratricopeptide (TPR) repeat protein
MAAAGLYLSLGQIALYEGDYGRARAAFAACLPMLRTLGWRSTLADALVGLGDAARGHGDDREAEASYLEALTLYRQLGDHLAPVMVRVLCRLANMSLDHGDCTRAQAEVTESLRLARDASRVGASEIVEALEMRATLSALQDAAAKALKLAGAAAALRAHPHQREAASGQVGLERRSSYLPPSARSREAASGRATLEDKLALARQTLSGDEQATAWAEGQAMTAEQAVAYALDRLPPARGTPQSGRPSPAGIDDNLPARPARLRVVSNVPATARASRAERQAQALEYLRTGSPLTPRACASMLGVSVDTALRDLRELVDRGLAQATGTTRDRRYVLTGAATETTNRRAGQ